MEDIIYIYIYIYMCDDAVWNERITGFDVVENTRNQIFSTALLDCQTDSTNLNECTGELP